MLKAPLSMTAVLLVLLVLASCMPAPAVASWEGEPVVATAADAVLGAEARQGYTRFTLNTARDPIDRVQWLITGEEVQVGALEPRKVGEGLLVEVSDPRTVHRLTAMGKDLCIKATFSFQGSNRPLFLEACEAELLALANPEDRGGTLKPSGDYSLRGNPNFSLAALPPEARTWYEKLWVAIEHPINYEWAASQASRDDIYHYSRSLYTHMLSLLTVFRLTGDLALLDEVDHLTQIMRSKLADGWRGTRDRSDGTRDGFLNWVDRYRSTASHLYGKDLTEIDEARAHSILAMIAFTFEVNRDLPSPSGVDYSERADFWKGYLSKHFEPKWRARNGVARGFPFILVDREGTHTSVSTIGYHWYMAKLTNNQQYVSEVVRQTDRFFREIRIVEVNGQQAYVWRRGLNGGDNVDYLMPTIYVRYVMADAVNYHFEGISSWNDPEFMKRMANTLAQLIMDNGATDFARDVGSGVARAGYAAAPREWTRISPPRYAISPFALIAPWNTNGKVAQISTEVFEHVRNGGHQYHVYIPAGMFLYEMLR